MNSRWRDDGHEQHTDEEGPPTGSTVVHSDDTALFTGELFSMNTYIDTGEGAGRPARQTGTFPHSREPLHSGVSPVSSCKSPLSFQILLRVFSSFLLKLYFEYFWN